MKNRIKIIRVTTVPISLIKLLEGQLGFMSNYFEVVAVSSSDNGMLEDYAAKEGVRSYAINMTRKITPLRDLIALIKMILFFYKEKPLIVHSHTPKAGLISMLAAYIVGVPHRLHTIAGLPLVEAKGLRLFLLKAIERLVSFCSTRVYPNSHGLKALVLAENLCPISKMKVIGHGSSNGIDTNYFNPELYYSEKEKIRKEIGLCESDFVFIFIGRMVNDKGINELVSAFNQLFNTNDNVKLLLLGNFETELSPLKTETISIINNLKNIKLLGYSSDIRPYLAISNFLVFPSYREGFPNAVMQSLAMNVPVIATDINGCNELISYQENGFLIPIKDEKALAEVMNLVYSNKNSTNLVVSNTREVIKQKFERSIFWNYLLDEYKTLVN